MEQHTLILGGTGILRDEHRFGQAKQASNSVDSGWEVAMVRSANLRPSAFEHRVQQHVAARRDVFRFGLFDFVVADAVLAGDENHAGWR